MGKLLVYLTDDVEREFRELVSLKYGRKKGALSIAVEEAVRWWIAKTKADFSKE